MSARYRFQWVALAVLILAITGVAPVAAGTASAVFTYDALGRVTTASYDNGVCVAYSYDANGNRTAQTNLSGTAPTSSVWGSGVWGCALWSSSGGRDARVMRHKAPDRTPPAAPPVRH